MGFRLANFPPLARRLDEMILILVGTNRAIPVFVRHQGKLLQDPLL